MHIIIQNSNLCLIRPLWASALECVHVWIACVTTVAPRLFAAISAFMHKHNRRYRIGTLSTSAIQVMSGAEVTGIKLDENPNENNGEEGKCSGDIEN